MSAVAAGTGTDGGAGASQPGDGAVRLTPRRVYIMPTRYGYTFALALAVMLLGSINYNNGLGHVLTFLLGSVALVSMLHTCRNLFGLGLRGGTARPVFAGETAPLPITLDNRGQPARHDVLVRHATSDRDDAPVAVFGVQVPPDAVLRVPVPVFASRRGRLTLQSITLATRYPFGLFRAWAPARVPTRTLVYPRPAGEQPLPASAAAAASEGGRRGQGREDFAGFRDYVVGDSPRRIHWKAVARGQGVPVKLFSGEFAGDLLLRWADVAATDTEARVSQLCRWVLEAEGLGSRYGLEIPGASVPIGRGPAHRHACLAALALFEPGGARA